MNLDGDKSTEEQGERGGGISPLWHEREARFPAISGSGYKGKARASASIVPDAKKKTPA